MDDNKLGSRGGRRITSPVFRRQWWRHICLLLCSVYTFVGPRPASAEDVVVGETICACQPIFYQIRLNFSLTCEDSNLDGLGFGEVPVCVPDGTEVENVVPVSVTGIQFLEVDESIGDVISQVVAPDAPYGDGALLNYTSSLADATGSTISDLIPSGIIIGLNGVNSDGEPLVQSLGIVYNSSNCDIIPEFEGKQLGWLQFIGASDPNRATCPGAFPSVAPVAVSMAPSEAATVTPSEAATMTPSEAATMTPSEAATMTPSEAATMTPSEAATMTPSEAATVAPSGSFSPPSLNPTNDMSAMPSLRPSAGGVSTIVDAVVADDTLTTLETAVIAADLVEVLSSPGPFTLFAPPDDAFAVLDQEYLGLLQEPPWILHLEDLLLYHVATQVLLSTNLTEGLVIPMANEESITVRLSGIDIVLTNSRSNSTVVESDLELSNGVLHTIDSVLLPSFFTTDLNARIGEFQELSTIASLIVAAALDEALATGEFTVLAPTNEAFDSLPPNILAFLTDPGNEEILQNLLSYHLVGEVLPSSSLSNGLVLDTVEGSSVNVTVSRSANATTSDDTVVVFFNDASVAFADVLASNGIIHGIDGVLLFPGFDELIPSGEPTSVPVTSTTPTMDESTVPVDVLSSSPTEDLSVSPTVELSSSPSLAPSPGATFGTVVSVVIDDDELATLESAVVAAGLVEVLEGPGPFTLFAPIDEAFDAFDEEYLAQLLTEPWILHLQNLLLYHTTTVGLLSSSDLVDGLTIAMDNNENTTVDEMNGVLAITGDFTAASTVIESDFVASNAVLHKVEDVLLPRFLSVNILDIVNSQEEFSTLANLIKLAELDEAIRTGDFTLLAPSNDAFAALPEFLLNYLADTDNVDDLQTILQYHLLDDVVPSTQLENGQQYNTIEGGVVNVTISDGLTSFNDALVLEVDSLARNGLVHTIESVLIPDSFEMVSAAPTEVGSSIPTSSGSTMPTVSTSTPPTTVGSSTPTDTPIDETESPTLGPSASPIATPLPTIQPVTPSPVLTPLPTIQPTTLAPVLTALPTPAPVETAFPTQAPVETKAPTAQPVETASPTSAPVKIDRPTPKAATREPTIRPNIPRPDPTCAPTEMPTGKGGKGKGDGKKKKKEKDDKKQKKAKKDGKNKDKQKVKDMEDGGVATDGRGKGKGKGKSVWTRYPTRSPTSYPSMSPTECPEAIDSTGKETTHAGKGRDSSWDESPGKGMDAKMTSAEGKDSWQYKNGMGKSKGKGKGAWKGKGKGKGKR